MDERRKAKRLQIRKGVAETLRFALLKDKDEEKLEGQLIDISDTGLAFTSYLNLVEILETRNILVVTLNFIKSKTTTFTVEVMHITNNICGCRIIERE